MYTATYYLLDREATGASKLPVRNEAGTSRHRLINKAREKYDPVPGAYLTIVSKREAIHYVAEGGRWSFMFRTVRDATPPHPPYSETTT